MKSKMGSISIEGANPIMHLLNRQIGNNIYYFRRNLFRERLASVRNLYRKNLVSHYGCVNAIEFSSTGDLLISGNNWFSVEFYFDTQLVWRKKIN